MPAPDLPPELLAIVDGGHAQTIAYVNRWIREAYPDVMASAPLDRTRRYLHTAETLFGLTISDPDEMAAIARLANLAAECLLRLAEHDTERRPRS